MRKSKITVIFYLGLFFFYANAVFASDSAGGDGLQYAGIWHFDEGQGDQAKDSSGHEHTGKITNARWTKGIKGSALEFDEGAFVEIKDNKELNFIMQDSFSLEAWIKTTEGGTVISKNKYYYPFYIFSVESRRNYEGMLLFNMRDQKNTENAIRSLSKVNDGIWHHVLVVRDMTAKKMIVYIDGEIDKSCKVSGMDVTNNSHLYIGGFFYEGKLVKSFKGIIDEVVIYRKALSELEVFEKFKEK